MLATACVCVNVLLWCVAMTQDAEAPSQTPTATVAARIRELRERRGLSARQLAERCAEAGADWLDRSIIANIESGRRRTITIDEVLVFAHALDVAPIHLFVPVDARPMLVTPKWVVPSPRAREWVRGRYPLPTQDSRVYRTEVPNHEWDAEEAERQRQANAPTPEELHRQKELIREISEMGAVEVIYDSHDARRAAEEDD